MASHLTVTANTVGLGANKGFGSSAEAGDKDIFAALLGVAGLNKQEPQAPAPAPAPKSASVPASTPSKSPAPAQTKPSGNDTSVPAEARPDEAAAPEDPEAVAAPVDATIPIVPAEVAKPELTELIEGLADLKARLAAGETLDGDDLAKLDELLAGLAQQLGIDLTKMPSADELAALVATPGSADTLSGKLVEAFGPLAKDLLGNSQANAGAELSAQIKAVGDKLAALLVALNQGELDGDQLAQLDTDATGDTDLQAALNKLLKPTVAADAAPVLSAPTLDIPEKVLTGKASTEAAPAQEATLEVAGAKDSDRSKPVDAVADKKPEHNTDKPAEDRKPVDAKPVAAGAQGAAEQQPDTNAAVQTAPAARVDVVAAPRVVQAGYQTSQQQLNLPQLAFELARQVGDGNTRFQIRLDPAELGRIDVRLDIDSSGQVNARMTVEKAETLDLMQRDRQALERALQQAGLDGSKTNLEFSLKQNPFSGGQQGQDGNGRNSLFGDESAEVDETPPPTVNLYRGNLSASGVNIVA